jgi:hypothetical protein
VEVIVYYFLVDRKREERTGPLINVKATFSVTYSFQVSATSQSFHNLPKSTNSWGPTVQNMNLLEIFHIQTIMYN